MDDVSANMVSEVSELICSQMDGVEMPERLKGALQVARDATTKRDVLIALRSLLTGRQDEALYLGR